LCAPHKRAPHCRQSNVCTSTFLQGRLFQAALEDLALGCEADLVVHDDTVNDGAHSSVVLCVQGRPFQAALEDLALGGEKDPIVRAALAALPQQLADQVRLNWGKLEHSQSIT